MNDLTLPPLPEIPKSEIIPYSAIRYVAGYTESFVHKYAQDYARAALASHHADAQPKTAKCQSCKGTGFDKLATPEQKWPWCEKCSGSGKLPIKCAALSHHEDGGRAEPVWCSCGDAITPDTGAKCGVCASGVALGGEPPCNPHPDAPHGYNRNASHNAGRYVCDCEGWAALGGEKGEAVAWQWQTEDGQVGFIDPWQKESGWEQANPRAKLIRPLFAAPVGKARMLTDEEADHITGMHNTGRSQGDSECAEAIQRKFCEVNGITLEGGNRSGG